MLVASVPDPSEAGPDCPMCLMSGHVSLVVQHDVRQPDVVGGHVQVLDSAVVGGVPLELVVDPLLGCYSVMS